MSITEWADSEEGRRTLNLLNLYADFREADREAEDAYVQSVVAEEQLWSV